MKGCQLNDCDATSWYTDGAQAKSKGFSFAARPAVSKDQPFQLAGDSSLRNEFTLLGVFGWTPLLSVKSEAVPTRRKVPTKDVSEIGQAGSDSGLGIVR